jgi:PKD repeat protein
MKQTIQSFRLSCLRACAGAAAVVLTAGIQNVTAQSIGCKFVIGTNGPSSGIDNMETDSMLPTDLAGVPSLGAQSGAQTNWNNFQRSGSGTLVLTNSLGAPYTFNLQWDSGYSDTTGTGAGLGTPDGNLMDGFILSWGPGAATPLGNSVYNSGINNKPLVYISGLNAWITNIPNAEGYGVVLYTTGYSYYETAEGYIESVTGSPLDSTMVEGSSLAPHLFEQDTSVFLGTYMPATGTSSATQTGGANYMYFTGFTNDAVLLRLQCGGYGAGLNAFQFIPIFAAPPVTAAPTFSPGSTVYAGVPTTLTEAATADPFHTNLWYQWYSDNATGGAVTSPLAGATNTTFNITPTNSTATYNIQYLVVVTNIFGASTSSVVTLTVNPAVAPFVTQDTTPGPGSGLTNVYAYAGGSVSFSAAVGGTPSTYLWQSNSVNIAGATSTTLTLNNLPLSASAGYQMTAINSVGGTNSTPASLVVLSDPAAPTTGVAYPHGVFTNGPVAYWRFSETLDNTTNSLQAYDYSGNNNNATYGIGASDNQPGPQSPAFAGFESTNSGISLLNNSANSFLVAPSLNLNTNTVTITAWINPSVAVGADWGLFMWVNGSDKSGFGFGNNVSNGVAELGYTWNSNSPSTYNFNSGLYPPLGQWSFVALTITPTNSTIYLYYIDGNTGATNLLKSVQTINNIPEAFSGGTTWIGSDSFAGRNFNGSMDEVAVFNKSLNEMQMQGLFLKAIGASGVAPTVANATVYPAASVYSGQNVRLSSSYTGTLPLSFRWQSSPDGSTWTDIPGATSSSVLVNSLTLGTVYYQLIVSNPLGIATNGAAAVAFNALPSTPPGLWTVNYQVTNNVVNYGTTVGSGVGVYSGRGILGTGGYWNVVPATAGAFAYVSQITSVSDLRDDGATHSGVSCSVVGGLAAFGSATVVQPDSSDIGNLLYQWVTVDSTNNSLQFSGLPDGTYNLCFYGCDGSFDDRGTTFVAHDARNGDQVAGTTNASPILPLQQGVNFVVMANVHSAGGTLLVDVEPTSPIPLHNPNGEADFNGAQIQLVSYDPPAAAFNGTPTNVFATQPVTFTNLSTGATNWVWRFGDGSTLNTASSASVSHAYSAAGTYTVSLTAAGNLGVSSVTNTAYIVVSPRPVIGKPKLSSGSFIFSGAGGIPGVSYRILTSTNVALPLADWTLATSSAFVADGSYSFTNSAPTNKASFFILVSP